jgi:hypothetical protein
MRDVVFYPGHLWAATDRYVRRRGRPRQEWVRHLLPLAYELAGTGSEKKLDDFIRNESLWKEAVLAM